MIIELTRIYENGTQGPIMVAIEEIEILTPRPANETNIKFYSGNEILVYESISQVQAKMLGASPGMKILNKLSPLLEQLEELNKHMRDAENVDVAEMTKEAMVTSLGVLREEIRKGRESSPSRAEAQKEKERVEVGLFKLNVSRDGMHGEGKTRKLEFFRVDE
jgi:hypothetical protein